MNDHVLVAYGSKYGATTEIAQRIGEVLRGAGLTVDVIPANAVPSVEKYAAVVLGSAVYVGQWTKEAARLLERNVEALAVRSVWLFSSGPIGAGDPVERMHGWDFPDALRALARRVQPRGIAFFHGKIDLSLLHFGERLIIRALRAKTGDSRDWDAIAAWADAIAINLRQRQTSATGAVA